MITDEVKDTYEQVKEINVKLHSTLFTNIIPMGIASRALNRQRALSYRFFLGSVKLDKLHSENSFCGISDGHLWEHSCTRTYPYSHLVWHIPTNIWFLPLTTKTILAMNCCPPFLWHLYTRTVVNESESFLEVYLIMSAKLSLSLWVSVKCIQVTKMEYTGLTPEIHSLNYWWRDL